ncbi:MAG: NUDIX hydrolase [Neisseriaceae bacterium]
MDFLEKKLKSDPIYKGGFITISRDQIKLPNGNKSYRIVINHPGAACVLATTSDNQVILVKQFRYAVGEALLEIPAGKLDSKTEEPAKCAMRELAEETPYPAESVTLLRTFYTAPGFCDEKMVLFRAYGVKKNSQLQPDPDEILQVVLFSPEEARTAIQQGRIKDAKSLIALEYWLNEPPTSHA